VTQVVKDTMLECAIMACRWNPGARMTHKDSGDFSPDGPGACIMINLYELANSVIPQVRTKLQEIRAGDLMKEFFRHDESRDGRLNIRESLEISRTLGLDQRALVEACEKDNEKSISYDTFQEIVQEFRELIDQSQRVRERRVKEDYKLDEPTFLAFREDLSVLSDVFYRFDADHSGSLTHDEIMLMLKECGLSPKTKFEHAEIEHILFIADKDRSGSLCFAEFLGVVAEIRLYRQERIRDEQMASFDHYDKDNGGDLSVAEISMLLLDLGIAPRNRLEQEELAMMIHSSDQDGSGTIDFEEFQHLSQRIDEKLKSMRYESEVDFAMQADFSEQQMRDFRWVFDNLDWDGSDHLCQSEVQMCMNLMQWSVPTAVVENVFGQLDQDESGQLDFLEFLEFMRIMRDTEGMALESALPLGKRVAQLDTRVVRRALEIFRLNKSYLLTLPEKQLHEIFCAYLGVSVDVDLHKHFNITTIKDLYELVNRVNIEALRAGRDQD
jgi:calcium-binding protein CML